ncbi:MAG: AAA family ATPase [Actinomycetia bacterium]|nr:AAA family ATPase [Actinomycetes bacterium]
MRPSRLEATAFGPFADTVVVDFTELPADRPFLIRGPTGAGKTSILDAMTYALYGVLPGHRSKHRGIRSDHAAAAAECEVTLEFVAGGEQWRVTRKPEQHRESRRGAGMAKVSSSARLEQMRGGSWEPVESKVNEIREHMERVLGLTAEQFQRVVLLPQGDFSDVLNASTSDREKLLRSLFGTEVFRSVLERLSAERDSLRDRTRHSAGKADALRASAASQLRDLRARLGLDEAQVASLTDSACRPGSSGAVAEGTAANDGSEVSDAADQGAEVIDLRERGVDDHDVSLEPEAPGDKELREQVSQLRGGVLASQAEAAERARSVSVEADRTLGEAEVASRRLARRDELRGQRAELEATGDQHEHRVGSVARHREAAPLVEAMDRRDSIAEVHEASRATSAREMSHMAQLLDRLDGLLPYPCEGVDDATAARLTRSAASELLLDCERAVADRTQARELRAKAEDLRSERQELANSAALLDNSLSNANDELVDARRALEAARGLATQLPALAESAATAESLAQARRSFSELGALRDMRSEARARLAAGIDAAAADLAEKSTALEAQAQLADGLEAATRQVAEIEAMTKALEDLSGLQDDLADRRRRLSDAESTAQQAFDHYVDSTAPRLAEELEPGQPCSVCGSREHPAPAAGGRIADRVDLDTLESARAGAVAARDATTAAEAAVARLLAANPAVADANAAVLEQRLGSARTSHRRALEAAGERDRLQQLIDDRTAVLDELRGDLDSLDAEIAEIKAEVDRATGALGGAAERSISDLDHVASEAAARVAEAQQATDNIAALEHDVVQVESTITAATLRRASMQTSMEVIDSNLVRIDREATGAEARAASVAAGRAPEPLLATLRELVGATQRLGESAIKARATGEQVDLAAEQVEAAVASSSFLDEAAVVPAVLDDDALAEAEKAITARREAEAVVAAGLEELEGIDLPSEAPDLEALREAAEATRAAASGATAAFAATRAELDTAESQLDTAMEHLGSTAAEQDRLNMLEDVVGVVSGRRTLKRVTLEAWVLASYLREVVGAANTHLRAMTAGRYELDVDSSHVSGAARSGLDIVVIDADTGRSRPTRSLSGGETFKASLAMALGLADVLTAGRSGRSVDALFVDEGFGTLDADSVDTVIEVLDGLRDRGTMVGLISHVEPIKEALPVAIEVVPRADRRGSELKQFVTV